MAEKQPQKQEESRGSIVPRNITVEMKESYLDYAMSVITSRALPDVRDGLKPVHRRILYAMSELGLTHAARFRKSAAVVGEVLGKYHPHGDASVYDALVKMAQEFSYRYPLILGQGNFGSVDGDGAAAMRYCVTGDTLIPTNRGLLSIDQMSEDKNENISAAVLSFQGRVNKANKWFDSGEHKTLLLKTHRGFKLQGSYNHPVLVWQENATHEPSFEWKLLSKVKEGDVVVLDRTPNILWPEQYVSLITHTPVFKNKRVQIKQLPAFLTEDLAFILGLLVSEGTIKEKEIEFCNSDRALIQEFQNRWQKVFPDCRLHVFDRKPSSYGKKPFQTIEIHSHYVIQFLKVIGLEPLKSKDKIIPSLLFRSPKSVVTAFLQAFFEGDGSISFSGKMTELSAVSMSTKLLDQIQIVLLRFGIASTRRFDKYRNIEKLYIRGLEEYLSFEKEINFASRRKQSKLRAAIIRLHKEYSSSDYIPFIAKHVRSLVSDVAPWSHREFLFKHNFDRYPHLKENGETVLSAVMEDRRVSVETLFKTLVRQKYLFDIVTTVKKAEKARVYSLRVESECHSFVGNGFINHNTEAKMSRLSGELLRDLEKETVLWRPNYDNTKKEPAVLPCAVPNLLLNGTLGIAVGMATNIPPHNIAEVTDAAVHLIENPDTTNEELLEYVQGPDFPTGGIIFNIKDILHAYATGRGGVVVRGEAEIVEGKGGMQIVMTSLPYRVNKAELVMKIADLVREKKLEGVRALRDESARGETRVVVDLKSGGHPQKTLNYLYKHTDLETVFHFNMLALVDGVPRTLSLKGILEEFIKHREIVVRKRTEFDLKRAEERAHILTGLKKALDHIDKIIKTIKTSPDAGAAHKNLIKEFRFSEIQATAILEMKLQKLAGLERKQIELELKEKLKLIADLKDLLSSIKKIRAVIKHELAEIKKTYGDPRRTKVVKGGVKALSIEDIVPDEETVVVLTKGGYIKRTNPAEYRRQKRGGVGVHDLNTKEEDFITALITGTTHNDVLFFTNRGKVYQTKMYEIPEGKRATKGKSIMNFLPLIEGEEIASVLPLPKTAREIKDLSLFMVTKNGVVKKVSAESFLDVRRSGIIAITLKKGDALLSSLLVEKGDTIVLSSSRGQAIRFEESDVRQMGRTAGGVRGMKLAASDFVVGADVASKKHKDPHLLSVSEKGYGKRTALSEYKIQRRGGSGIKTAKVTDKTGRLIVSRIVTEEDAEIVVISKQSQVIRVDLKEIPSLGRQTQGVRVMKLRDKDSIATFICL